MQSKRHKKGAVQSAKSFALEREIQLAHEQALRDAAIDAQIKCYAEAWKAEQAVAWVGGIFLGFILLWLELACLWTITQ